MTRSDVLHASSLGSEFFGYNFIQYSLTTGLYSRLNGLQSGIQKYFHLLLAKRVWANGHPEGKSDSTLILFGEILKVL